MARKEIIFWHFININCVHYIRQALSAGMVSLTFDDGLASVYKYAYPILKNNNQLPLIGITCVFLCPEVMSI